MDKIMKMAGVFISVVQIIAITLLTGCTVGATLTVCHATGDPANPYQQLSVNSAELDAHRGHPDEINPAPVNGCPTTPLVVQDGKITICHATSSKTNHFDKIEVSVNGLNGHEMHEGDLIPAPQSGCPTTPVDAKDGKITICHATNGKNNPYNEITVSINGLNGHNNHEGDIIPAPSAGCPATK